MQPKPTTFRYGWNPNYVQSLLIGLKHGFWDLPLVVIGAVLEPIADILLGLVSIVVRLAMIAVLAPFVIVVGASGFLRPATGDAR